MPLHFHRLLLCFYVLIGRQRQQLFHESLVQFVVFLFLFLFSKECRVVRASGPYMSRVLELNHVFYEFLLCTTKLWILILVLKSDGHSAQHKERERKLVDVTGKRGNAITY
jgi:hypothetical protein